MANTPTRRPPNYPSGRRMPEGTRPVARKSEVDRTRQHLETAAQIVQSHRGIGGPEVAETLRKLAGPFGHRMLVQDRDSDRVPAGTTNLAISVPERLRKQIQDAAVASADSPSAKVTDLLSRVLSERIPQVLPANAAYDGRFRIPTLEAVIDLARSSTSCDGREIGIYPETKHPSYFDSIGLSMEEPLVDALDAHGYDRRRDPVIVQSFEVGNLEELDGMTDVTLAQLVNCSGHPADDPRPYSEIVTRAGLREVATYADGVGLCKDVMIPREADGTLGEPTPVIKDAHRAGLTVHGWTFRAENTFLPTEFRSGPDPRAHGDMAGELRVFLDAGMDGAFSDQPDVAAAEVRR